MSVGSVVGIIPLSALLCINRRGSGKRLQPWQYRTPHSEIGKKIAERRSLARDPRSKKKKKSCESIGSLDSLFHALDLMIGQELEMTSTFANRKSAMMWKAGPDEEIDLPIWHVDEFLHRCLGPIVVRENVPFLDQFCIDGLL